MDFNLGSNSDDDGDDQSNSIKLPWGIISDTAAMYGARFLIKGIVGLSFLLAWTGVILGFGIAIWVNAWQVPALYWAGVAVMGAHWVAAPSFITDITSASDLLMIKKVVSKGSSGDGGKDDDDKDDDDDGDSDADGFPDDDDDWGMPNQTNGGGHNSGSQA
jgi:hypothetical protein